MHPYTVEALVNSTNSEGAYKPDVIKAKVEAMGGWDAVREDAAKRREVADMLEPADRALMVRHGW